MMKLVWHKEAKEALRDTATYIRRHFGQKVRARFRAEVALVETFLISNPRMGIVEPLLANRKKEYRSFVIGKLNKIVYYIEDDTIHIADFWDTRREPNAQARQVNDES